MFMSDEALGCYMRLLVAQWYQGGLPNDINRIASIAATVRQHWPVLADKFPVCEDGMRRNPRLEEERAKAAGRTERALRGASTRWKSNRSDAQAMLKQCSSNANASFEHMPRASGSGSYSPPTSPALVKSPLHHGNGKARGVAEEDAGDGGERQESPAAFLAECGVSPRSKPGQLALAMLTRAEAEMPGTIAAMRAQFGDVDAGGRWTLDPMYRKSRSRGLLMREMCATCCESGDAVNTQHAKIREQIAAIRERQGASK